MAREVVPVSAKSCKKQYLAIQTQNECRLLLISDPKTTVSAFALNTGVGSTHHAISELAELIQVALMNTKVAGEESDQQQTLSRIIDECGGVSSGFEGYNKTGTGFQCDNQYFFDILNKFMELVISPNFEQDVIESVAAVFENKRKTELSHKEIISRFIVSKLKAHHKDLEIECHSGRRPFPDDIAEIVKSFYEKEYSSNRMAVALISNESIDCLKTRILPLIERIPNRGLEKPRFTPANPLENCTMNRITRVVPKHNQIFLQILWATPDLADHYKSDPTSYMDNLLQNPHENGISDYLLKTGLAVNLSLEVPVLLRDACVTAITVQLTPKGFEQYEKVLVAVLKYLNLMKKEGLEKWRLEEYSMQSQIEFDYDILGDCMEHVIDAVHEMTAVHLEDVERFSVLSEIDVELTKTVMETMRVDNCAVFVIAKQVEEDGLLEQSEGIKFDSKLIDEEKIRKWEKACEDATLDDAVVLRLPPKNEFTPHDLNSPQKDYEEMKLPETALEKNGFVAWYKCERINPHRMGVRFGHNFREDIEWNAKTLAALVIHQNMIIDKFNSRMMDAMSMKFTLEIEKQYRGLEFYLEGFSERMELFVAKVLDIVAEWDHEKEKDYFEVTKSNQICIYEMEIWESCSLYDEEFCRAVGLGDSQTNQQILHAMRELAFDEFQSTRSHFYEKFSSNVLIIGDIDDPSKPRNLSKSMYDRMCSMGVLENETQNAQFEIEPNLNLRRVISSRGVGENGILIVLLCGPNTPKQYAIANGFCEAIKEKIVGFLVENDKSVSGIQMRQQTEGNVVNLSFNIRSRQSCEYLDMQVELFLQLISTKIEQMSEDELKKVIEATIESISWQENRLLDRACNWWSLQTNGKAGFEQAAERVEMAKSISKQDLIDFYNTFIKSTGKSRSKVSVYMNPVSEQLAKVETSHPSIYSYLKAAKLIETPRN